MWNSKSLYRPNHKENICVFKACAITTHSSDACLRKQRPCSYGKAGGCVGGGLDMQEQQRRVWELRRRRGVSEQTTEVVTREGGGAVMAVHKREDVGSRLQCLSVRDSGSCRLGHLKQTLPGHDSVSPPCVICLRSWLLSDKANLSSEPW